MRCLLSLTIAIAMAAFVIGCEAPSDSDQTAKNAPKRGRTPPGDTSATNGPGGNAGPGAGPPGGGNNGGGKSTLGTITSPGGGLGPPQEGPGLGPPQEGPGAGQGGGSAGGGKGGLTGGAPGGGGGKGGLTGGKGGLTGGAPGGAPGGGPPGGGGALGPPADGPQGGPPSFDPDAGQGPVGGQPSGGKGGLAGGAPGGGAPAGGPPGGPVEGPGAGAPGRPGGGFPGASGGTEEQAEELTLRDKAMNAFRDGDEDDAFQYMYAYYLTDNDAKEQIAMGYLPAAEEPRAAVRWGVSLTYIPSRNFEGAPPRIGDEPNLPSRGGERGGFGGPPGGGRPGGPPGGGSGSGTPPNDPAGKLSYYLGEFGELALERLSDRRTHNGGFYGDFLASVEANGGGGGGFAQGGGGFAGGRPGGGFNAGGGGGAGKGGLAGGASSPQGGPPGDGPPGGGFGPPAGGAPGGGGRGGSNRSDDSNPEVAQLLPGVLYLGEGDESDMVDRARNHNIDALLHFTVKTTLATRTNVKKTEAKVELIDVKTGKSIYSQRRMFSNISVWNERERNSDAEPVQEELDKVFAENADEIFRLQEMPQLSAEDVKTRIDVLTSSKPENPLMALAEVKYYYDQELIDETAVIEAFTQLGCKDAEDLANGTQEEKTKAISKWMPGNFDAAESDDEFR